MICLRYNSDVRPAGLRQTLSPHSHRFNIPFVGTQFLAVSPTVSSYILAFLRVALAFASVNRDGSSVPTCAKAISISKSYQLSRFLSMYQLPGSLHPWHLFVSKMSFYCVLWYRIIGAILLNKMAQLGRIPARRLWPDSFRDPIGFLYVRV